MFTIWEAQEKAPTSLERISFKTALPACLSGEI